jgi:hypothetical protein
MSDRLSFELKLPRKWRDVAFTESLRASLTLGWFRAQNNSKRRVPIGEFLDSVLAELERHHVILLVNDHAKFVGTGPFMVALWQARRYPHIPIWIPRWEVDWAKIWDSIVPAEESGQLIWLQKAPIPWDRDRRLEDMLTPSLRSWF